jgi:hypothetical protein
VYRLVDCDTWSDTWFESLETPAKLFFLYLLTNPRSTTCGAFEISTSKMSFETAIPRADIERWLSEWSPRVTWFPAHNIVWLRNFYRHQGGINEKSRINARRIVAELPPDVIAVIGKEYPDLMPPADTVSTPETYGMHTLSTREQETEQETERAENESRGGAGAPAKAKRAKALLDTWVPTEADLDWAMSEGFSAAVVKHELFKFTDHFTANGKTMKDWSAAWRNWMRRSREFGQARASPQAPDNGRASAYDFARLAGADIGGKR